MKAIYKVVLVVTIAVTLAGSVAAQKTTDAAPIPPQIMSAKKVFISNAAGDDLYSDDPSQVYSAFYTAMKGWGRYQIVSAPIEADLVFEVSFRDPIAGVAVGNAGSNVPVGGSYSNPHLRVVILDPKTHVSLWWFLAHVKPPLFTSDRSLDHAIADLMAQLKQITSKEMSE
jgi:hypothetical protein